MTMPKLAALVLLVTASCNRVEPALPPTTTDAFEASYEVHAGGDLTTFLRTQPSGSTDALIILVETPQSFVVVNARILKPPKDGVAIEFVSEFDLANGEHVSKGWRLASPSPKMEYRAIFGLPNPAIRARTRMAL